MKLTDEFLSKLKDINIEICIVPEDNPFKYSVWGDPPGKYKLFHNHYVHQEGSVTYHECLFDVLKDTKGNYHFQRGYFDWNIESFEIETIEDFKKKINDLIEVKNIINKC